MRTQQGSGCLQALTKDPACRPLNVELPSLWNSDKCLLFNLVVLSLFGTRDQLHGRHFFHGPGWGDDFRLIQVHYIYHALCFYFYYTSSTSDHQALDPRDFSSVQFSSVAQSCPTLCDPMNCCTPGLPVHHQLPEFTQTHVTQTHVHRVSDAIQPSRPLSSPSPPAPNPSQHQSLFQ